MTHRHILELFAWVCLICGMFVIFVDLGAEYNVKCALRLKWSIAWYAARYIAAGCAFALAFDVIGH